MRVCISDRCILSLRLQVRSMRALRTRPALGASVAPSASPQRVSSQSSQQRAPPHKVGACVSVCVRTERPVSVLLATLDFRGSLLELQWSDGCGHRLLPLAQSWADWAGLVHSGMGLGCGCSLCWLLLCWLCRSDCTLAPPPHLTGVMMSLMMSLIAGLCRGSRLRFPIMLQATC